MREQKTEEQSICKVCDSKKFEFMKEHLALGLLSSLGIIKSKSLSKIPSVTPLLF